jgi:hypothetical protein
MFPCAISGALFLCAGNLGAIWGQKQDGIAEKIFAFVSDNI